MYMYMHALYYMKFLDNLYIVLFIGFIKRKKNVLLKNKFNFSLLIRNTDGYASISANITSQPLLVFFFFFFFCFFCFFFFILYIHIFFSFFVFFFVFFFLFFCEIFLYNTELPILQLNSITRCFSC